MPLESSVKLQAINDEYTLWTAIMDDSKRYGWHAPCNIAELTRLALF